MRVNPVLDSLGAHPIAELQDKAVAMRAAGEPLIDFSIGDPREPTPDFIKEALRAAVPDVSQYPTVAGTPELRHAVSGYLHRRFGIDVDPDTQVLPTAGEKEAIFTSPFAFVDPLGGEAVVYGTPGYPIYERGARFAGAEAIGIRLQDDFILRAADIGDDVWDRTRMVWICSPHNPTGSVTPLAEYEALWDRCRSAGALLMADECYADIYEGAPPPSILQLAGPDYAGVLAFFSCSKRSGMTGYRSGAIIGDAAAIAALRRLRSSVGVGSPVFIQAAAVAAWSDDDHAAERRAAFAAKRAVLRSAFEAIGLPVVASGAGLYIWVRVGDDQAAAKALLEEGVLVSPGSAFGPGGEGHLRLALVPTPEDCRDAVEVVQRCLQTVS